MGQSAIKPGYGTHPDVVVVVAVVVVVDVVMVDVDKLDVIVDIIVGDV